MATRWQEGVCRRCRQAGRPAPLSSPVEENAAAMPCWAQRRLESQCTVSTSSSSQDPSDIALPRLQPLPVTHSVSARTHTMHSASQTHAYTNTHSTSNTLKLALSRSTWHQQRTVTDIFHHLKESKHSCFLHIANKNGCLALAHLCALKADMRSPQFPQHHQPPLSPSFSLSSSVVHGR